LNPGIALSRWRDFPRGNFVWFFLLLAIYSGFVCAKLGASDLTQDEGSFGISALNIRADYHQLAMVGEQPAGPAASKPFLYPVFLLSSIFVFGQNAFAIRIVNVIALAVASIFLYASARSLLKDDILALLASSFFLLNAGTISYGRLVTADPFVVLWGCVGLFGAVRFYEEERARWAMLSGFGLGLAFLSKLWLIFPYALACLVLFVLKFLTKKGLRFFALPLLAFVIFLFISSLHLLAVIILTPHDLSHWLDTYFGISLGSRVAGGGFDPAMWYRPWWFYFAGVFKITFFVFPMILLGTPALTKRRNLVLTAVVVALILPIFLLSLFRVKETVYIFPVFPGLAIVVALGLDYFFRTATRTGIITFTIVSMLVAAWFYRQSVFAQRELILIEVFYLVYLLAGFAGSHYSVLTRAIVVTALLLATFVVGIMAVRRTLEHRTYYREIAEYFKNRLRSLAPGNVAFVSPEFAALSFSTFRTGQYWQTYYFHEDDAVFERDLIDRRQVFYVVDPSGKLYGGQPSPGEWQALREHAHEISPEVEAFIGHPIALRIFVPSVTH
jgi:4-amino-4-deoxy-L-arabinose transferase-like glycosyltransferase